MSRLLFLRLLFLFSPFFVGSEATDSIDEAVKSNLEHPIDYFLKEDKDEFQQKFYKMLGILALLVGFMILASIALKKMMKQRMVQFNAASEIQLVDKWILSPKTTIFVVKILGETFILSEGTTSTTLLHRVTQNNHSDKD